MSTRIKAHIPALLITLGLLFAPKPCAAGDRYWVFLRDKGSAAAETGSSIAALRDSWPERSLNRRMKSGVSLDESDLPLRENGIQAIQEAGGRVVAISRWFNAVSVTADAVAMRKIAGLSSVSAVQPVAKGDRDATALIETGALTAEEIVRAQEAEAGAAVPLGSYGPSRLQAEMAGVVEAHRRGLTGAGVLIGALDTGFQLNHRAFAGLELVGQYDFIYNDPDPSYNPATDPVSQAGHGTGCLSVIVGYDPGYLVGIAPRAAVAVAKTEDDRSETEVEEDYWIAGLEWLEWLGAEVVTSSLTYRDWYESRDFDGERPLISRAAQRACELGMIICNSAGNGGPGAITIGAPADAPGVLAIGAVDSTGRITRFSSRGPSADGRIKPDVAALGQGVVCVTPLTWGEYGRWRGTSLSCPIVAGVAALVLEAHPDWPAQMVVEAIRATADRAFMPDNAAGYGIVNAVAAIDYPELSGRIINGATTLGMSGVTLELTLMGAPHPESNHLSIARSDSSGWFKFVNLPGGTYDLTVKAALGESVNYPSLTLPPSLPFDIVLRP